MCLAKISADALCENSWVAMETAPGNNHTGDNTIWVFPEGSKVNNMPHSAIDMERMGKWEEIEL